MYNSKTETTGEKIYTKMNYVRTIIGIIKEDEINPKNKQ